MKVLYCSHYSGIGGANLSLINLIRELRKDSDFECTVLLPEEGPFVSVLEKNGVEYIVSTYYEWVESVDRKKKFSFLRRITNYYYNISAAKSIANNLKGMNIDIVHTNDSLTVIGAYLAKMLNVPHVWHFREFLTDYRLKFIYSDGYVKKVLSKTNEVVCVSEAVKNRFISYLDKVYCSVVYNGIPIKHTYDTDLKKYENFTIFFAGGDIKEKGFDLILSILDGLKDNSIKIIIAGNIKKDWNQKRLAKYKETVKCIGFVNNISEYRSKCHASLMISENEAFGRVTIESMAEQTIVIATNSGANSEIITNLKTGLLLENNDADTLLAKIVYLKHNYEKLKYIEEMAFAYAKEKYEIARVSNDIYRIYNSFVKGDEE